MTMQPLYREHPAQLCWGFLLLVEEQAREKHQLVFTFLAQVARPAVLTVREVIQEIVREAGEGTTLVDEVAKDGVITTTEARQIRGLFEEIETEAREGRVIR